MPVEGALSPNNCSRFLHADRPYLHVYSRPCLSLPADLPRPLHYKATHYRQDSPDDGDPILLREGQFPQVCSRSSVIGAGLHGLHQLIAPAKNGERERQGKAGEGTQPPGDTSGPKGRAPCHLRVHERLQLLLKDRDEAQGQ